MHKLVKLGGGAAKIVVLKQRCKVRGCESFTRDAPGAVCCWLHKMEENNGCAEHDKKGCTHRDCK